MSVRVLLVVIIALFVAALSEKIASAEPVDWRELIACLSYKHDKSSYACVDESWVLRYSKEDGRVAATCKLSAEEFSRIKKIVNELSDVKIIETVREQVCTEEQPAFILRTSPITSSGKARGELRGVLSNNECSVAHTYRPAGKSHRRQAEILTQNLAQQLERCAFRKVFLPSQMATDQ